MTGVNDLAEEWDTWKFLSDWRGRAEPEDCAEQLREAARTAWHPVSEPPTEADGDHLGHVAVWWTEEELFGTMHYRVAPVSGPNLLWARINDVVLLPDDK